MKPASFFLRKTGHQLPTLITTDTFDQLRMALAEPLTGSCGLVHRTNSPKCERFFKIVLPCVLDLPRRFDSISAKCWQFKARQHFYSLIAHFQLTHSERVASQWITDLFRSNPAAVAAPPGSHLLSVSLKGWRCPIDCSTNSTAPNHHRLI